MAKKIPESWKKSITVLAYKNKGDKRDLSNWRPICLQNTVYKLYAACIAKRIASWAIASDVISHAQKGFLPFEGCFKHTFLLQSCMQDARRRCRKIYIAWLDLKNAFGSVPTNHLLRSMEELGLTGVTLEVVKDIYTDSTTKVRIGRHSTEDIVCGKGVKQGCPLSPILFDLALEQLIEGINQEGYNFTHGEVSVLAYTDDLCFIAESHTCLQEMLHRAQEFVGWTGLQFKASKCATLSLNNRAPRHFVENTKFHINGEELPVMNYEDHYCYLGCQLGANPRTEANKVGEQYLGEAKAILTSLLTDWQKLNALHRFVKPKLDYTLRTMFPTKGWAKNLDNQVRSMAKKAFRLPRRTNTPYFYTHWRAGGLGLPNIEDELDVAWASQAFKYLISKDPTVVAMTAHRITSTIEA